MDVGSECSGKNIISIAWPLYFVHIHFKFFCISRNIKCCIKKYDEFGDRHGEPNRVSARDQGQEHDQDTADDTTSGDRYDKGDPRFHESLEIIGRKDVERQQEERDAVAADHGRGDLQDLGGRLHKNVNIQVRPGQTQRRPEYAEDPRGIKGIPQNFFDAFPLAGAEVYGYDRLGGLPHAVCTALDKGAHADDGPIDGKRIRPQVFHDLTVE